MSAQYTLIRLLTWLMSAAVHVLHLMQVHHNSLPLVVDVVKRRRLEWQLSPDVFTEKYVLRTVTE